ncbi:MAG: glycosyltransferase family 2 protein [Planctomycetota bacterium]
MPTSSLIITTYNWPRALELIFESVRLQVRPPDEIHIADDGSRPDTAAVIRAWQERLPMPVQHHWQEDIGFRPNPIRNEAAAHAGGDILITIDGDMILHPHFVDDHVRHARPGHFIQPRRIRLDPALTARAQKDGLYRFRWWERGVTRRHQAIRSPLLARLLSSTDTSMGHIRGANMSMWRSDFLAVNGFNEDILGWGFPDHDLTARFYNLGLRRTYLRHAALAYHLDHGDAQRDKVDRNRAILEQNRTGKVVQVANGLRQNHEITHPETRG